jgi:hypothetical protein
MPTHVLDISPSGPLVYVGLSVGSTYAVAGLGGPPQTCSALVDTGSTVTAISPAVRRRLQPQQTGRLPVSRIGGTAGMLKPLFDVRLKLMGHLEPFRWFDLEVVETAPASPGIDVLIGQDLLSQLTMLFHGPLGKLVLMY